jgi:hypothetical protein
MWASALMLTPPNGVGATSSTWEACQAPRAALPRASTMTGRWSDTARSTASTMPSNGATAASSTWEACRGPRVAMPWASTMPGRSSGARWCPPVPRSRTLDVGDDADRVRGSRLCGLSQSERAAPRRRLNRCPSSGVRGAELETAATLGMTLDGYRTKREPGMDGQPGLPRPLPLCRSPHSLSRLRKGSYRLARIAAKHGPEITLRDLLDRFSYDCVWRTQSRTKRGRTDCGVYLPDLEHKRPPDMPPGMVKLRLVRKA